MRTGLGQSSRTLVCKDSPQACFAAPGLACTAGIAARGLTTASHELGRSFAASK